MRSRRVDGWSLLSPHSLAVRCTAGGRTRARYHSLGSFSSYTVLLRTIQRLNAPVCSVRAHVATTLAVWPANATCQATLLHALLCCLSGIAFRGYGVLRHLALHGTLQSKAST